MSHIDEQDVVVMSWGDGPFEGMTVGAAVSSMAALIAVEDWDRRALSGKPIRGRHIQALAAVFVRHVTRWNITLDSGRPAPVTVEGFLGLHRDRVRAVLRMWVQYVHTPPESEQAAPEVEDAPVVDDLDPTDPMLLLESRSLQPPGEGEQLVASTVEPDAVLVDA